MGSFRTPVCWGAGMARDENDQMIGYQAYSVPRKQRSRGMSEGRVTHGPVCATYAEAAEHARKAQEGR